MQIDGRALRDLRRQAGLTQAALAEGAEVDRSHLSAIENGYRGASAPTAKRLADALGVKVKDIEPAEPAEVAR